MVSNNKRISGFELMSRIWKISEKELDIILDTKDNLWYENFAYKIYLGKIYRYEQWWHNVVAEIIIKGELWGLGTPLESTKIVNIPNQKQMDETAKNDLYPIIRREFVNKYIPSKMNELFGKDLIENPQTGEYEYRKDFKGIACLSSMALKETT